MGSNALGFTPRAAQKSPGRASLYLDFRDQIYVLGGWLYGSLPALGLTNSRSTPRTVVRNGTIVDVPAGENAIGDNGLSVLGSLTRLNTYPQLEDNIASVSGAVITDLGVTSDGFTQKQIASAGQNFDRAETNIGFSATANDRIEWIFLITEGTSGSIRIQIDDDTNGGTYRLEGDPDALSVTVETGFTGSDLVSTDLGGGRYEIRFATVISATSSSVRAAVGPNTGSSGETVIWEGYQASLGYGEFVLDNPSSSSSVDADNISIPLALICGFDPSQPFTVLCEYETYDDEFKARGPWQLLNAAGDNGAGFYHESGASGYSPRLWVSATANSGNVAGIVEGAVNRVGVRVSDGDSAVAANGGSVAITAATPAGGLTRVVVGKTSADASQILDGKIRQLLIIPEALSDAELQAWTGA